MKKCCLFLSCLLMAGNLLAQNPFAKYGYDVPVVTMTNGRLPEFHDTEVVVEIGLVRFNAHTKQIVGFIENGVIDTLPPAQLPTRFVTQDPLAEKYYSISPYVYVANNPIKFIDPDGRDILIHYGAKEPFRYTGKETITPADKYVQQVIMAYNHNVKNGGGRYMKMAAENKNITLEVKATDTNPYRNGNAVYWNSELGVKLVDGNVLSPATMFEHEAAHVVRKQTGEAESNTLDLNNRFDNPEEEAIIKGTELETAKANGELPKNHQGRPDHQSGTNVYTTSPVSNKVDKTREFDENKDHIRIRIWNQQLGND